MRHITSEERTSPLLESNYGYDAPPLWMELLARALIVLAVAAAPLSVLGVVLYYAVFALK